MANKRQIKKSTEAIASSVCESMMFSYYNVPGIDQELVEKAIANILTATGAVKHESNRIFGKGVKEFANKDAYLKAKRIFFKELFSSVIKNFNKALEEAMKLYNSAIPAEVKAEYKKLASEEAK